MIRSNNLFSSALRNGSGNRIVLLSAKMNPSVGIRRKKHSDQQTNLSELLSTIIRERQQSDQESVVHAKIALAISHRCTLTTSTSACRVARTSTRRMGNQAPAFFFFNSRYVTTQVVRQVQQERTQVVCAVVK